MEATTSRRHDPGESPAAIVRSLRDGTLVGVRDIRADDAPALRAAFERLSPEARYRRFLRPVATLTDDELRYLTEVDGRDHVALVAVVESHDLKEEHGVGVGRFIRLHDLKDVAEIAITVADAWQERGVGSVLLRALAERARDRGIERFHADMLGDHEVLPAVAARGARLVQSGAGTVDVELPVDLLVEGVRRPSKLRARARSMWR